MVLLSDWSGLETMAVVCCPFTWFDEPAICCELDRSPPAWPTFLAGLCEPARPVIELVAGLQFSTGNGAWSPLNLPLSLLVQADREVPTSREKEDEAGKTGIVVME